MKNIKKLNIIFCVFLTISNIQIFIGQNSENDIQIDSKEILSRLDAIIKDAIERYIKTKDKKKFISDIVAQLNSQKSVLNNILSNYIYNILPQKLISNNININFLSDQNLLKNAIDNRYKELSKIIINAIVEHNGKIDAKNNKYTNCLILAIKKSQYEIVELLIKYGVNVNSKDNNGNTPLIEATINNNILIVKLLLENNADANIKDKCDATALMYASHHGYKGIVKLLITYAADVNIKNESYGGTTALIYAVIQGNSNIVKSLIKHKADVNTRQYRWGYSSLMIAKNALRSPKYHAKNKIENYISIIKFLKDAGAKEHKIMYLLLNIIHHVYYLIIDPWVIQLIILLIILLLALLVAVNYLPPFIKKIKNSFNKGKNKAD